MVPTSYIALLLLSLLHVIVLYYAVLYSYNIVNIDLLGCPHRVVYNALVHDYY